MNSDKTGHSPKKSGLAEHSQFVNIVFMVLDMFFVNISYFAALWFRFDCRVSAIEEMYLTPFYKFAPFYTVICLACFWFFGLYRSIWKFASFVELERVIYATLVTSVIHIVAITVFFQRMPISYYFMGSMLQFFLVLALRFLNRFVVLLRAQSKKNNAKYCRVMVIGAGNAGRIIVRELNSSNELEDRPVCMIDDDSSKWNKLVDGVPVVGGRDDILLACEKYSIEKIYLAIPTAKLEDKRDILNICKETGCKMKSLPGVYQLVNGEVNMSAMQEIAIEDLLGRDPIKVDMTEIYEFISGKTILVTGGGGSIGSELCRQIAKHSPKQLIIFDIYENDAYNIMNELTRQHPKLDLKVMIGSVRDSRRVNQIFRTYRPDVVYHAAAHKHVPLMEVSPCEAIKNNAIGTYKVAYAAMMYGTQRFVLISTDKAVNPTNIMGASKRICEMIIQSFDKKIKENRESEIPVLHVHLEDEAGSMYPVGPDSVRVDTDGKPLFTIPGQDMAGHIKAQTEFVAVRFGNVLGSSGSVIPLFKEQIADGGPVTVTHPDIIRYFMTIPEAAQLVLQAGTYAKGGEIFVLDMGEPVKIDDLARNLIKLCGYEPDVDIAIEYTGLRPGEKLFEEKLMAEEGLEKTKNKLIHIGHPVEFNAEEFLDSMEDLMEVAYKNFEGIRIMVQDMVSTYNPYDIDTSKDEEYREMLNAMLEKSGKNRKIIEKVLEVTEDNETPKEVAEDIEELLENSVEDDTVIID